MLAARLMRSAKALLLRQQHHHRSARLFTSAVSRLRQPQSALRHHPFLTGSSAQYLEGLEEQWIKDRNAVHPSWAAYFKLCEEGVAANAYNTPPTLGGKIDASIFKHRNPEEELLMEHVRVNRLVRAFQTRGHRLANLDPLGILKNETPPELTLEFYGFSEKDLDKQYLLRSSPLFDKTPMNPSGMVLVSLRDVLEKLKKAYCGNIGHEYMFIQQRTLCDWLRARIEDTEWAMDAAEKKRLLHDLILADSFEEELSLKYPSEKRFGLEGCEALVPGMLAMLRESAALGVEAAILGMPHRGRLNVLHNVLGKPLEVIFQEFKHVAREEGQGDVKYHLGMNSEQEFGGKKMFVSLTANPSHLEAVNPVVLGRVRSMQRLSGDHARKKVLGVLLHGDGAFSGQGVVYESIGMSHLPEYCTGGTIHIVCNNQIAFTTDPRYSRSSEYSTDVAKMVGAPIFHVNGDHPEEVVRVFKLAAEWQHTFTQDVVIDLVGYRRHGHNEVDQPMFTQPLMYKKIEKHLPVARQYMDRLIREGVTTQQEITTFKKKVREAQDKAYETREKFVVNKNEYMPVFWDWHSYQRPVTPSTGVPVETLREIGIKASTFPVSFDAHSAIKRILHAKIETIEKGVGIDWATAEMLAFGSLLVEGVHVRLSGQDVERGPFSQRHHVLHDQSADSKQYVPLRHLSDKQAEYIACNSHLSEFAVLGFDLGYSLQTCDQLVLWEAEFGDFVNGASVIIDNFLCSGETKWGPQTGLVMLLPHGYEGQGPEHSSGRLERLLQLCDDNESIFPKSLLEDPTGEVQISEGNWQVANCTTPANYFHVLRRQLNRTFRKPLVVMTPKSLLRHRDAKSTLTEMGPGTTFTRMYPEIDGSLWGGWGNKNEGIERVIFCSGKVYYDLMQARHSKNLTKAVIARVEQISPFPFDLVQKFANEFPNADIVWCQEEPKNMGAWTYVEPRMETALKGTVHENKRIWYAGRPPAASPATGVKQHHLDELNNLIASAFKL